MVSRRNRLILASIGLLLVLAALTMLVLALLPGPVESLRATLDPGLFVPPQVTP